MIKLCFIPSHLAFALALLGVIASFVMANYHGNASTNQIIMLMIVAAFWDARILLLRYVTQTIKE